MLDTVAVTLPGGFWCEGECHRTAMLRPLNGEDEAFLSEMGTALLPAQRVTALLSRCVGRLGDFQPVTYQMTRSLCVGDREALLLQLRRLSLGDKMSCLVRCPRADCGETIDAEVQASDMLLHPYAHCREQYEEEIRDNGTAYRVRFRLPTGADQETAAVLARENLKTAAELILRRCVAEVAVNGTPAEPLKEWPPSVARRVPVLMAHLDPQAELWLTLTCPECDHNFTTLLDTATYLFQELAQRLKGLYREVHYLAFYYHWREAEILALPSQRRQRYLELLAESLAPQRRV